MLTTRYNGSGWVPLRRLDTQAGTLTKVAGAHSRVRQDTQIDRSADGSLLFLTESNISSGPLFTYNPLTNTFGASAETQTFLGGRNTAVNKDGTLIAIELGGVSIMTGGLKAVENLPGIAGNLAFTGGLAFDPVRNVMYALETLSGSDDFIVAFNTSTWKEEFRFRAGENVTLGGSFGSDTLRVSDDGLFLTLGTPSGVRIFDLAPKFGRGPSA